MTEHASGSANQLKTEPVPSSPRESEAETPAAPASDQAHAPGGIPGDTADVLAAATEAAPGSSEQLPVVQGLHVPELDEGVHRD